MGCFGKVTDNCPQKRFYLFSLVKFLYANYGLSLDRYSRDSPYEFELLDIFDL